MVLASPELEVRLIVPQFKHPSSAIIISLSGQIDKRVIRSDVVTRSEVSNFNLAWGSSSTLQPKPLGTLNM